MRWDTIALEASLEGRKPFAAAFMSASGAVGGCCCVGVDGAWDELAWEGRLQERAFPLLGQWLADTYHLKKKNFDDVIN